MNQQAASLKKRNGENRKCNKTQFQIEMMMQDKILLLK